MRRQLFCISKSFLPFLDVKICRNLKIAPKSILFPVIWITNKCNLQCRMCDQWNTDPALASEELSASEWYSFVDSARRMRAAVIVITGGEPFLREDLCGIIKYIRKKNIACHVCTNGTLLNKDTVNRLKGSGLNSITISLDSDCAEIHNQMRGADCFDGIVKGMGLLRRTVPEVNIGINCVITKRNFHNIWRMIPFAEKLGVDQIKFDPVHTNLMHRKKDLSSFAGLLFDKDDFPELRPEINKLIHAASQTKLLTNSPAFMKGILNLYGRRFRRLRCYAGYISCAVDALGRVSPCDNFDGCESLRSKPLEEIWKSPNFNSLREKVDNCNYGCWDSTHAELNIRCSTSGFLKEFSQILREMNYYLFNGYTNKKK